LSTTAVSEFESLAVRQYYPARTVLLREGENPSSVMLLHEGRVKVSLNSSDGRRLILGFSGPGEFLGLTSAVSGLPYEITAETQFGCTISLVERRSFLEFLICNPIAFHNATCQLGLEFKRTTQQLRTLGLSTTAQAKLARLLIDWCPSMEHAGDGTRIQCPLTHGEIGEHIGVSRETVTRSMSDFKNMGLLEQRGTILVIRNRRALEVYASAC